MALLGEEEGIQESSSGTTGTPRANPEQLQAVNGLQPKGQPNPVTVNDFRPQDDKSGATGDLGRHTYYPTLDHNIAVGNYSTSGEGFSMSGSTYAPAGMVVPIGMMDARDAAIHHAALRKQAEDQDFMKKHQYAPTKLDSANPEMSAAYFRMLNEEMASAKKKYGKNAAAYLNSSPDFAQKVQAFHNAKITYDNGVDAVSKYDVQKEKPGFVPSQESENAKNEFLSGHFLLDKNPSDPKAQAIGRSISRLNANNDLDTVTNTALDKSIAGDYFTDKTGNPMTISDANGNQIKNPKYQPYETAPGQEEFKTVLEHSTFAPERLKTLATQIKESHPFLPQSVDQIYQNLAAKKADKITYHSNNYSTYHPAPDQGKLDDYSNNPQQINTNINAGDVTAGETSNYIHSARAAGANDTQTKLQFAGTPTQMNMTTKKLNTSSENFVATPQSVVTIPYNATTGKMFKTQADADAEIAKNPHNIKYRTGVIVNQVPEADDKEGTRNTYIVSPEEVRGRLKKKQGSEGFDGEITKQEEVTRQKNEEIKKLHNVNGNHSSGSNGGTTYKGTYYSPEVIARKAKESNMTPEEYLIELSKQK